MKRNRVKTQFDPPTPAEIRSAQESAGLTQAQAGEIVFSSKNAWHQWANGLRRMNAGLWLLFRIITAAKYDPVSDEWRIPGDLIHKEKILK